MIVIFQQFRISCELFGFFWGIHLPGGQAARSRSDEEASRWAESPCQHWANEKIIPSGQGLRFQPFGAFFYQQQVAALDSAAQIGDRCFVTAMPAPGVGQPPLADVGRDGFAVLASWLGESGQ